MQMQRTKKGRKKSKRVRSRNRVKASGRKINIERNRKGLDCRNRKRETGIQRGEIFKEGEKEIQNILKIYVNK